PPLVTKNKKAKKKRNVRSEKRKGPRKKDINWNFMVFLGGGGGGGGGGWCFFFFFFFLGF
ncbi:hypothetical protein, partial [Escherichia coli]|uniref:hypothetical protein n=1 Tax=Escherichia coli TaxID=562 RepID=UPI001BC8F1D9